MKWLRAIWHDPVWSKVISGVILGALAVGWAARAWVFEVVTLNRSQVVAWAMLGLVVGIIVGVGLAKLLGSKLPTLLQDSRDGIDATAGNAGLQADEGALMRNLGWNYEQNLWHRFEYLAGDLLTGQAQVQLAARRLTKMGLVLIDREDDAVKLTGKGLELCASNNWLKPTAILPAVADSNLPALEEDDLAVLKILGAIHSASVRQLRLKPQLRLTEPRTLLACERLQQNHFVFAAGTNTEDGSAMYELSTAGREECHRRNWL